MPCIHLNNITLKILVTHFSYTVTDTQWMLKKWKVRNLALEGKTVNFKTIAISKILFQSFIATALKQSVKEFQKIQKAFFGKTLLLR